MQFAHFDQSRRVARRAYPPYVPGMKRTRRGHYEWVPLWLAVPLLLIVLLISLPITLPIVSFLDRRDKRRQLAVIAAMPCVNCGIILGLASMELAQKERWAHHARHSRPGYKYRLARLMDALCPACRTPYLWESKARAFEVTTLPPLVNPLTETGSFKAERGENLPERHESRHV